MRPKRKRKQLFICFVDICLLFLSLFLALFIRRASVPSLSDYYYHLNDFYPIIIFWIILQYIEGMYVLESSFKNIISVVKILAAAIFTLFYGFAWFYLTPNNQFSPKTILALFCGIGFLTIYAWRLLFTIIFLQFAHKIIIGIIGISPAIRELINYSADFSFMGYDIVAIFDENYESSEYEGIPVYTDFERYIDAISEKNITQIVLIRQKDLSIKIQKKLFFLLEKQIHFTSITQFYESYIRKIPLSTINELWFLQNIDLNNQKNYVKIKRIIDILIAGFFFILTTPIYPFIILAIKLESKGNAFFTQVRTGFLGKNFTLYKFRTMTVSGNTFAPTEKHDARITKFGNFMRKTRLDEIPQLLNVIRGDMSIIGPRPERPELIIELEEKVPFYKQRLLVKPGITGWDQVSGEYHSASIKDTYKKLQYDLYYIKNMSVFLDISIIAKTIRTVLVRSGR